MEQVVACALVTQRARVRSPVGTRFVGEVFSGFFLTCKTNVRKLWAHNVPEYHLAIIIIHHHFITGANDLRCWRALKPKYTNTKKQKKYIYYSSNFKSLMMNFVWLMDDLAYLWLRVSWCWLSWLRTPSLWIFVHIFAPLRKHPCKYTNVYINNCSYRTNSTIHRIIKCLRKYKEQHKEQSSSQSFVRYFVTSSNSPNLPSLHLRHNSFPNPSVALPTSQLILQPFCCFTYVTAHSPTLLSLLLCHKLFT